MVSIPGLVWSSSCCDLSSAISASFSELSTGAATAEAAVAWASDNWA